MTVFGPFEVNPSTHEPFLCLRKHPNIILTPPRESDIAHVIPPLNDDRVHVWHGTAYPYRTEHAQKWITRIKADCGLGLQELLDALKDTTAPATKSVALTHLPVRFLREIQEDGTDTLLGDIGIYRCSEVQLLENAKHDTSANLSLPAGHPDIIWTLGGWIVPSHHRRGIMTDAVDTLIHDLAKPLLGAMHFTAMVFVGNEGSKKVFLKNDFALTRCITNNGVIKGFMRDLDILERCDLGTEYSLDKFTTR